MRIFFNTLTPIWTGGVDKSSQAIHETGIIGSMRWWYEGVVRGLGGYVCDPTNQNNSSNKACKYNPEKPEEICPACKLFGCTGWRRQFKLTVDGLDPIPLFFFASPKVYTMAGNWLWRMFGGYDTGGTKTGKGQNITFTFGSKVLWGRNASMSITPLGMNGRSIEKKLNSLLKLISHWGALGAKGQNGFGKIELISELQTDFEIVREDIRSCTIQPVSERGGYFSLRHFFSVIYELSSMNGYLERGRVIGDLAGFQQLRNHFVPCAFDIRYKSEARNPFTGMGRDVGLRPWIKKSHGKVIANELFGNSLAKKDEDRSAGKVGVSHFYKTAESGQFYLNVWGTGRQKKAAPNAYRY